MGGLNKLSAKGVSALKSPGRHSDGGGLYLRVKKSKNGSTTRSWSFMWKRHGVQRELGLGSFDNVSLKSARVKASEARAAIASGDDPRLKLNPVKPKTFLETGLACIQARGVNEMNPKTKRKWERTVLELCKSLHSRPISNINREDILKVLSPIWNRTPETGRIVRSQLEIIFNYAKGRNWYEGENPALWRGGLDALLSPVKRSNVKHHAAMHYDDLPNFMDALRSREAMAARALEFTILTAARTNEALQAVASEFDLENGLWVIPDARMKSGRSHTVPLPLRAVEIVHSMREAPLSEFIFPGQKSGRPLSNMTMAMMLRRMKVEKATVHGFRSTFRDWAGDKTSYSREVAEAALSHSVGDIVERSYRRGDALDKRRRLMKLWADFCDGSQSGKIVRLRDI